MIKRKGHHTNEEAEGDITCKESKYQNQHIKSKKNV